MPSQTLLAFMLYQGQLLEYFNVSAQTPIDPRTSNELLDNQLSSAAGRSVRGLNCSWLAHFVTSSLPLLLLCRT